MTEKRKKRYDVQLQNRILQLVTKKNSTDCSVYFYLPPEGCTSLFLPEESGASRV
jgi:hypothetical protein